ncbi:hypothetical protein D3C75_663720 [compost metagenome]
MNPIIATLKSKGLTLLSIVLATLLTVSYLSGKADREQLTTTQGKLLEHVQLNKRLSDQNLELAEEIKNKPAEYITIVKEVEKQVCNGIVKQQLINSLPSKKEVTSEHTANIDDRLPSDLIKLLK